MKAQCGFCHTAPATLYCSNDAAFLCTSCDSKVHGTNPMTARHQRNRVCDLCDAASATIYCKNDEAHLCPACDAQIHGSNPLAARHERFPLQPLLYPVTQHKACGTVEAEASCGMVQSSSCASLASLDNAVVPTKEEDLLLQTGPADATSPLLTPFEVDHKPCKEFDTLDLEGTLFDMGMGFDLGTLDMDFFGTSNADGVVPTFGSFIINSPAESTNCGSDNTTDPGLTSSASDDCLGFTFPPALCDTTSPAGMPLLPPPPHTGFPATAVTGLKANTDWGLPGFNVPVDVLHVNGGEVAMNREARVMRYREKRARRTFQKTIRYQSRKAYAEIRPRIKGRFATREEVAALKVEQALAVGTATAPELAMPTVH